MTPIRAARPGPARTSASCEPIPEETAGPYPGDGSNGPNALTEAAWCAATSAPASGRRRARPRGAADLRADGHRHGAAARRLPAPPCTSGTATARAATRCTRRASTDENYLRGVQEADADGKLTFTTIFPACYSGRWPHVHFEVYAAGRPPPAARADRDVPAGPAPGRVRAGVRHRRLRAERAEPERRVARVRQRVQRGRRASSCRPSPAMSPPATPPHSPSPSDPIWACTFPLAFWAWTLSISRTSAPRCGHRDGRDRFSGRGARRAAQRDGPCRRRRGRLADQLEGPRHLVRGEALEVNARSSSTVEPVGLDDGVDGCRGPRRAGR